MLVIFFVTMFTVYVYHVRVRVQCVFILLCLLFTIYCLLIDVY